MFSLRIFTINYYLATPQQEYDQIYTNFRCSEIKQVPILRVFGLTPEGQKACLHVHNAFPYLLIRYYNNEDRLEKFKIDMANSIDRMLNLSMGLKETCPLQHVYKIEVLHKKPMYGYHESDCCFLKISLYNPEMIRKLSELLINGTIMNEIFQPYYSHVPYNLQFLMDYNLFGMNYIYLDNVKFRKMTSAIIETYEPDQLMDINFDKWNFADLPNDVFLDDKKYPRQTLCELELDCSVEAILNQNIKKNDYMLNPGLNALWEDEKERRELYNLSTNIEPVESQEHSNLLKDETEIHLRERLIELLEKRFNQKYPFSVTNDDTRNQFNEMNNELNDEDMLNILDSLQNDDFDEDYNENFDSDLVQMTQLNEEEKLKLIEENNEMSSQIDEISKKISQNTEDATTTDDTTDLINNTSIISTISGDSTFIDNQLKEDNQLNEETLNPLEFNQNTSINTISDEEIDENKKDDVFKTPKSVKMKRHKFKGSRKMVVRLDRFKVAHKAYNYTRHYCQYYGTHSKINKCKCDKTICLNCDFKKDHVDSLDACAFNSPVNENKNRLLSLPIFDSPTSLDNSDEAFVINESIMDMSVSQDVTKHDMNESLSQNDDSNSFEDINDDNELIEISSEDDGDIDIHAKAKRDELKRKIALDCEDLGMSYEEFGVVEDNNNDMGMTWNEDNSSWFCPQLSLPKDTELTSNKLNQRNAIACYTNENSKKWKLNLDEMKTKYRSLNTSSNKTNQFDQAYWYTPAVPFPTNDKILLNKSIKRKKLKLKKNESQSESQKYDEKPKLEKRKSVHFAINDTITTDLLDRTTLNKFADDTIITYDDETEYTITNETQFMDTTGTFNQTASFYEYKSILDPTLALSSKSKHFESFIQTQDLTNTFIDTSKLEQTHVVKQPFKHQYEPVVNNEKKHDKNNLTLASLELHINTRLDMQPNANIDEIRFICLCIYVEAENRQFNYLLVYDAQRRSLMTRRYICLLTQKMFDKIEYVYKEEDLFKSLLNILYKYNPDLLAGFETQKQSWAYLIQRAMNLGINDFAAHLSRMPKSVKESFVRYIYQKDTQKGKSNTGEIKFISDLIISGRIILNIWRLLRSEISLNIYTFENCCYHILHERTPKYTLNQLNNWFEHNSDLYRWRTIQYYLYRCNGNIKLLTKLNLLSKTSEFARVFGIEFYHVLSRGSQYRVESMMLRIANQLNYIPVSPSVKQKSQMRASECIPLTLEPESMFYQDPVAILDFQSLYPSVIISFNICFTTCLGRIESIGNDGSFKFGCTSLFLPDSVIKKLDLVKDVYIAPNGCAFVKSHIRKGVLPIMLEDILKTRVMVKNSMKLYKNNPNLLNVLDSRQLSLKLIANVTFGYTAANFSGRMPCMEVGDSIVRQARQILENSIKYVNSSYSKYGGRVVYGDTDSMFILFTKQAKELAFKNAYEIAADITSMYMKPVKLKFEKIYYPCVLISKKRYVGYMYETPEQVEPKLDAKGIEIVRRDGCQIASKLLEKCVKLLFEYKDVEKLKYYFKKQLVKLTNSKVNLNEFIIAKEYRGKETYSNMKSIAACQIISRLLVKDPLSEPLVGERVPYLIVYGAPNVPLYELVRSPQEFILNDLKLNYEYYAIKQIIPPLDRILSLMNVNIYEWITNISFKPKIFHKLNDQTLNQRHVSLTSYFFTSDCILCGKKCNFDQHTQKQKHKNLCIECSNLDDSKIIKLKLKFKKCEQVYNKLMVTCQTCTSNKNYKYNHNNTTNSNDNNWMKFDCCSFDCPNMYMTYLAKNDLNKFDYLRNIVDELF